MGLAIYVENRFHEREERILDDAEESFMQVCEAAPVGSVRSQIARHGDTMLNVRQLNALVAELETLPERERTEVVMQVMDAGRRAARRFGYLYFVGD